MRGGQGVPRRVLLVDYIEGCEALAVEGASDVQDRYDCFSGDGHEHQEKTRDGRGPCEGSLDISIVRAGAHKERCRWWAWATPGLVEAHVGWRTHGGRIPARRIKPSVLCCATSQCTYSGTGTYTLIKEAEGSKRETRRDGRRETRNEIRRRSRAKPAEGRGMTEPWTWVRRPRPLGLLQLAANPGGGAQGRYDGYMWHPPLSLPPAPLPLSPSYCQRYIGTLHGPGQWVFPAGGYSGTRQTQDGLFALIRTYVPQVRRHACLMEGWPAI